MQSFLDPAILFFMFGIFAGTLKSNLEIPPQISRFLSLYLLMALGLKGGFALAKTGLTAEVAVSLVSALALATLIPLLTLGIPTSNCHARMPASSSTGLGSSSSCPPHQSGQNGKR